MRNIDHLVSLCIENMSTEEKVIVLSVCNEQVANEENDYNNFIDWLGDYAHTYLFESGEDK